MVIQYAQDKITQVTKFFAVCVGLYFYFVFYAIPLWFLKAIVQQVNNFLTLVRRTLDNFVNRTKCALYKILHFFKENGQRVLIMGREYIKEKVDTLLKRFLSKILDTVQPMVDKVNGYAAKYDVMNRYVYPTVEAFKKYYKAALTLTKKFIDLMLLPYRKTKELAASLYNYTKDQVGKAIAVSREVFEQRVLSIVMRVWNTTSAYVRSIYDQRVLPIIEKIYNVLEPVTARLERVQKLVKQVAQYYQEVVLPTLTKIFVLLKKAVHSAKKFFDERVAPAIATVAALVATAHERSALMYKQVVQPYLSSENIAYTKKSVLEVVDVALAKFTKVSPVDAH